MGLTLAGLVVACGSDGGGAGNNNNNNVASPVCGNGQLETGEECDDGAGNSDSDPDACRSDCRLFFCGDNTVDSNEFCDDGNNAGGDGCAADCSTNEVCGNGLVDLGEECDDGNVNGGDGCGPGCTIESCGNGIIDDGAGETCDDANFLSHDGCSSTCRTEVPTWTQLTPPSSPSARRDHAMAYDSDRGVLVLFGGRDQMTSALDDTWEFDGQTWQQVVAAGPGPLAAVQLAYHSTRQRMVLFGGLCLDCLPIATENRHWEYDGASWTESIALPLYPPARAGQMTAFDPVTARLLVFGGCASFGAGGSCTARLGDTWTYGGTPASWQEELPPLSPPVRHLGAIAYDPVVKRMILFGGNLDGARANDLWRWDGAEWLILNQTNPPSARGNHAMVYDPRRAGLILFGGFETTGLADTWEYDGSDWQEHTVPLWPAARWSHTMSYFPPARGTILFGGWNGQNLGDTWLFRYDTFPAEPDELCDTSVDEDGDSLVSCADPDCEALWCGAGQRCSAGVCQ